MSDTIISLENLSKKYRVSHQAQKEPYKTLRDSVSDSVKNLIHLPLPSRNGSGRPIKSSTTEDFWALKDVSFDVRAGQVVGIIGRNGAGKSTLLKILSRITEPTGGRVRINGRVASLLEVGTGFHPELTGRENIYLNGAILGMRKVEINRKFDEIVAFSEVEKFLDTPVKRYSSGMYVRLAFSVAAHLEPEILVVDEVLAVGDAQFQKKCMAKMQAVASNDGRTVLFVSHNIPSVARLCGLACWLQSGNVRQIGKTDQVLNSYLKSYNTDSSSWTRPASEPEKAVYIRSISVSHLSSDPAQIITVSDPVSVSITIENQLPSLRCQIAARISTAEQVPLFTTTSTDSTLALTLLKKGENRLKFVVPGSLLTAGWHNVICAVLIPGGELLDAVADQVGFEVHPGLNHATHFHDGRQGLVTPLIDWLLNCDLNEMR